MDTINVLLDSPRQLYFPLKKHGYLLEKTLNDKNRWYAKLVCSIVRDSTRYVSTTYAEHNDYLKLLETTTYLRCNRRLSPEISRIYPKDKTVVCNYTGKFLSDYLLSNPAEILLSLSSVFDYLKDINAIAQEDKTFIIPSIIKTSLYLFEALSNNFEFLPKTKTVLAKFEQSNIKFTYGCGIEDPHIWNFRIIKTKDKTKALTTDFDYFSDTVNYFWELGYFYATFRWFRKLSFSLVYKSEEVLLSLIQNQGLKSEVMFWLGVLSSYCGYKDSIRNLMINSGVSKLKKQYKIIQQLDEKVSFLSNRLLRKR